MQVIPKEMFELKKSCGHTGYTKYVHTHAHVQKHSFCLYNPSMGVVTDCVCVVTASGDHAHEGRSGDQAHNVNEMI